MKHLMTGLTEEFSTEESISEILILPDGKILVHNLSSATANMLMELNPNDQDMKRRAAEKNQK